ncbi:MAG: hypothetical protein KAW12_30275 [Candidatus Aminicenantes bacterium]|nr:hypothetical protein [Candidatus Aminicenantes bacterium]
MLKKELKEIILPALLRLSTLLMLLLILWAGTGAPLKGGYFVIFLPYIIFWIANNFGLNAFKCEYKDNSFEYLLSFPLSKGRIFLYKFAPRAMVLIVLTIVYEVLASIYLMPVFNTESFQIGGFAIFDPVFFPAWVFYFLAVSFAISLFDWKSLRIIIGLLPLLLTILVSLGIKTLLESFSIKFETYHYLHGVSFLFGAIIAAGILGAAFALVYKKFDLRGMTYHRKKFLSRALPPLLLLTAVSVTYMVLA